MFVQYRERHDVVAEFDPDTGQLEIVPRPEGLSVQATDGWFSILAGVSVVFFRSGGRLWLRVGERTFDLDANPRIDWKRDGRSSIFVVSDEQGEAVLRYESGPRSGPSLADDPTPFIESEDWDLGLFIANVMFDAERAELVRRGPP